MSWLMFPVAFGFFIGLTIYDPLRYGSLEDLTTVPAILVNRSSALYEQLLHAWSRLSVLYAESGLHEWLTDTWRGVLCSVVSLGSIVHHSGLTPLVIVLFIVVVFLHRIEAVPLPYVPRFLWVWFWDFRANFLLRYDVDQDGEATRLYVERALEPFTIPLRRFVTLLWGLICLAGSFGYHLSIFVWTVIRMATWGPFFDLTRRLWVQIQLEYDRLNPWEEVVEDADEEQDSDDEGENDRVGGIWNGSNERRKRNKKEGGKADQSKEGKKRNRRKAKGKNKGKGGRKR